MGKQITSFDELASTVQVGQVYKFCVLGTTIIGFMKASENRVDMFTDTHAENGIKRGIAAFYPKQNGTEMRGTIDDRDFEQCEVYLADESEYADIVWSGEKHGNR
jgi:hypothetical protein